MHYPKGLISYVTQNGLRSHWTRAQMLRRILRPRILIYTTLLLLLCVAMLVSLTMRSPMKVDVVRDRAALSRIVAGGRLENVYRLQIMNATERAHHYHISVKGLDGIEMASDEEYDVGPAEARWVAVRVQIPYGAASPGSHPIRFVIESLDDKARIEEKSIFLVPR